MSRALFGSAAALVAAAVALSPATVMAQTVKIGVINSYSGFVAQAADEMQKGIDLYVKEHEKDLPAGVKLDLIKRDDTSKPDVGKRLAQELIARDHVNLLAGRDPVAGRRRGGAVDRRGQGAVRHHQRCRGRDPAAVALCRAGLVHPVAGRLSDRQMGGPAGLEDRLYLGHRLYRRARRRGGLYQGLYRWRRQDHRRRPLSASQSGFHPVHPAGQGRQARCRLSVGPGAASRRRRS